jgi:hypothetical protein
MAAGWGAEFILWFASQSIRASGKGIKYANKNLALDIGAHHDCAVCSASELAGDPAD